MDRGACPYILCYDGLQPMGSQSWARLSDQPSHFRFLHPLMELIIETNPNIQLGFNIDGISLGKMGVCGLKGIHTWW